MLREGKVAERDKDKNCYLLVKSDFSNNLPFYRCVITVHKVKMKDKETKLLAIFNLYCPRADPEKPERLIYKLQFYKLLEIRAHNLRKAGYLVIILGDINCSHHKIDHCDPYEEFYESPSRNWMSHFLEEGKEIKKEHFKTEDDEEISNNWKLKHISHTEIWNHQFIDSFRKLHPDRKEAFTCWNTEKNCRENNYGTRIDYIFTDINMA